MNREKIVVIDFGGQYNQLVARRVRECNVYCEIYSYKTDIEKIKEMNPKGIILTGGPNSVYEEGAATCSKELFELGIPVLGLCYGAQLMSHVLGGHVCKAPVREYGKIEVTVDKSSKLFGNVSEKTICWMSHNDYIEKKHRALRSLLTLQTVRLQLQSARRKIFMQSSSIQKYCIPWKELKCCPTSYMKSVAVQVTGRWMPS